MWVKDSVILEPDVLVMNGTALLRHCDSLLVNKGSNIIDIYCPVRKNNLKDTVTCTFRPRWAEEERKLIEIYPNKVVRQMRKAKKKAKKI